MPVCSAILPAEQILLLLLLPLLLLLLLVEVHAELKQRITATPRSFVVSEAASSLILIV